MTILLIVFLLLQIFGVQVIFIVHNLQFSIFVAKSFCAIILHWYPVQMSQKITEKIFMSYSVTTFRSSLIELS